jgi:hypothetical protein
MSCFGCRFLCQGGDGSNTCLRFDHDGDLQGTALDDRPEPLYPDCWTPFRGIKPQ